jgi:cell division control protein 6
MNNIHLNEYDYEQLLEILRYRASEAFYKGAVSDEVLEFMAQAASDRKDARYAIDLLWRSGKFAELEGSDTVTAEHVRRRWPVFTQPSGVKTSPTSAGMRSLSC